MNATKHIQVLRAGRGEEDPAGCDARRRCLASGALPRAGEGEIGKKRLELALRKSRLVVETDFAGRKKRDGKCAGRVQQVPGTCSHARGREKKWGAQRVSGAPYGSRCGPRIPRRRRRRRRGRHSASFPFPLVFSFLSFTFFLFFLYIRLAQTNRANEWGSAWGPWPVSAIFSTTSPRLPDRFPRESGRHWDGIRPSWTVIDNFELETACCERNFL